MIIGNKACLKIVIGPLFFNKSPYLYVSRIIVGLPGLDIAICFCFRMVITIIQTAIYTQLLRCKSQ